MPFTFQWLPKVLGPAASASVYSAVGLSSAAVAGFAAFFFQADPYIWSMFGFVLPIGPLYFYFSRGKVMERHLVMLREWKNRNLINEMDYERLRKDALRWYGARHFGADPRLPEGTRAPSLAHDQDQPKLAAPGTGTS